MPKVRYTFNLISPVSEPVFSQYRDHQSPCDYTEKTAVEAGKLSILNGTQRKHQQAFQVMLHWKKVSILKPKAFGKVGDDSRFTLTKRL